LSPATAGILRPSVYVTTALLSLLSTDEIVAVLCHEWAYVLRRDTVWFLPAIHTAWRRMVDTQEAACASQAARMIGQPLSLAHWCVSPAMRTPRAAQR
jgi:Zn-dependent protease with chaperone function